MKRGGMATYVLIANYSVLYDFYNKDKALKVTKEKKLRKR